MANYQSGLLNDFTRRQNQRRSLTGLPTSYQEMRGMMDPMLENDARKAHEAGLLELQGRGLRLQEQARKDQAKAAMVSGVGQIAQLPMAYGSAKNLGLLGSTNATPTLGAGGAVTAQGAVAPAAATTAQGMATAAYPGIAGGTAAPGAVGGMSAVGGEAGAGLTSGGGAGLGLLGAAGSAAGLLGAQYLTGKALQPTLDKAGFSNTGKGWTYAGLPGASVGAAIDVGKKVINEAKDFIDKLF